MPLSPKAQAQIDALKARVKNLGAKVARGWKGSAMAAGTGAAGYYIADYAVSKVEFLQKDYVLPAVLMIGGHVIKKKQYDIGTALLAIGAFLAAQTFKINSDKPKEETPGNLGGAKGLLDGGEAGWMMVDQPGTAGALQQPSSAGTALTSDEPGLVPVDAGAGALITEAMQLRD